MAIFRLREPDTVRTARPFQGNHEFSGEQRMLQVQLVNIWIDGSRIRGVLKLVEQFKSFSSEAMNERLGNRAMEIGELRARSIQVTVVEEQLQPAQKLLVTAADEGVKVS